MRIFGRKEEVAGDWKRSHNVELHNLYASPNISMVIRSRRMRWTGHVARMREITAYDILTGKSEGTRPLGRPRCRCEDNIRIDFREIRRKDVVWMHLSQDRDLWWALENTVMETLLP